MFLRSLTLKGFKSFADTTELTLEPGVTVVVGPNGSGKSNVVDAIAWVLGAQGPAALRSQKMNDVVFAGTDKRAALGRAEVTLVIDNSDGELPVDTAEVAIARRLYRTGESEYLLNGEQCRLADLADLLSDAGVGRQQHVIVAQGQIEQVLSARPAQRREVVEEAAGILKFRLRKERAERRLASTQANLDRLSDMQREVRRRLRPLERQAESAGHHARLVREFDALRLHRAGRDLASLQARRHDGAQRRRDLLAAAAAKQEATTELAASIAHAEDELDDLGVAAVAAADRLPRVVALAERARGLLGLTKERLRAVDRDKGALLAHDVAANYEDEQSRIAGDLDALDEQDAALEAELVRLRADRADAGSPAAAAGSTDA
ncbi:MAG TPA: chromosome segregation protein SMC, partial [Acidimicrobiaceae bacterium]|nr:chromosome segregation protein SMC [Acidimicrobiaceae bacterium]